LFQVPAPTQQQWDAGAVDHHPGDSMICFGLMPSPVEFVYDGHSHINDLNVCYATPLKGLIRTQENRDDWWLMRRAYDRALKRLAIVRGEPGDVSAARWKEGA
jgi:hypothetical protein